MLNQTAIKNALEKGEDFDAIAIEIDRPEGKKHFVTRGQRIRLPANQPVRILLRLEEDAAKVPKDVK